MARIRLKYIQEFRDRHGGVHRYFRKPGCPRVRLPGLPGSTEFMAAYEASLAAIPGCSTRALTIGAQRTRPGSINAAITGYYASKYFLIELGPETQKTRRFSLEKFRADHGDKLIANLTRDHIEAMVEAKRQQSPSGAQTFLKSLRGVINYAVKTHLIAVDPSLGIKNKRVKTAGYYTWTEEDIARFEEHHPIGSRARLALALLLHTAQRRSDVLRMGPQHIRHELIEENLVPVMHITQQKTSTPVAIPVPGLTAFIDATPSHHLAFLITERGTPFAKSHFSCWFKSACREAGVMQGSSHGLRKAACRRLAEAGCTAHEIMSISGHVTLEEVQRYTEEADRAHNARQAVAKVAEHLAANAAARSAAGRK
jgi:integrase